MQAHARSNEELARQLLADGWKIGAVTVEFYNTQGSAGRQLWTMTMTLQELESTLSTLSTLSKPSTPSK